MLKRKGVTSQDADDRLELMPLGAGSEVGRSCVYMSYKGKTVLFDCGIHPAYTGISSLPFFDEIDPSTVDVLLVTHFHLDHAASLPYFLAKTNFRGRVFMTHATKAVYRLLLSDFVRVSRGAAEDTLFTEQDIQTSMEKIEVIDFHQLQEVNGIKFWCYTAGHVLGAAMFAVDIAGVRVLYTGDYSREEDRHLCAAEVPPFSPDLCIIESTYGVQVHEPRAVRERRFLDYVTETVMNGGRVLIPAFALGRAQELLLILDEHWRASPHLQHVPLYYASPLARKTMAVYRTFLGSMNERIREQAEVANPFDFEHVKSLKNMADFADVGPAVVMASPGGLQSGLSRVLFDQWCQDRKNTCLIPGYVVEGTLAKTLLSEPKEVTLLNGTTVPLRMQVHYVSFSAHADFPQTSAFLEALRPPNIVLVHGEANEMGRLRAKLEEQFNGPTAAAVSAATGSAGNQPVTILTPKNCQAVEFFFKGEKAARAVGRIAEELQEEADANRDSGISSVRRVSGLLVRKGFTYHLLSPSDLPSFTELRVGSLVQRLAVPFHTPFAVLRQQLECMFEAVEPRRGPEAEEAGESAAAPGREQSRAGEAGDRADITGAIAAAGPPCRCVEVHFRVIVAQEAADRVVLQWVGDPVSDMVADAVVALILSIEPEGRGRLERSSWELSTTGRGKTEAGSGAAETQETAEAKTRPSMEAQTHGVVKTDAPADGEGRESRTDGAAATPGPPNSAGDILSEEHWQRMRELLQGIFGSVEGEREDGRLTVTVDGSGVAVRVMGEGKEVEVDGEEEGLKKRVREVANRYLAVLRPIPSVL